MFDNLFIVLMAEDNEHDVIATKRAWDKHNIQNQIRFVRDGEECLDYLYKKGKYSEPDSAPDAGILLLDINMPKKNGIQVLKEIRSSDTFKNLPVIMLTTSKDEQDRLESYDLGANAYIIKPVGFLNFAEAIKEINLFWQLVELPYGDEDD